MKINTLMDSTLAASIIGIFGVVFGIFLSEYFRRKSKIEKFTEVFFNKRIDIYDKLFEGFLDLTNLFNILIESEKPISEKMEIWQHSTLEYLSYMDKKYLFIGEELIVHLGATFIGAGEFIEGNKDTTYNAILGGFKESKLLIKSSLGLHLIETEFTNTSKSKLTSHYIKYYNKVRYK